MHFHESSTCSRTILIELIESKTKSVTSSLYPYVQAMVARAMDIPGTQDKIANLRRSWAIATTCTGCGTFEMCFQHVADALSTRLPVNEDEVFSVIWSHLAVEHESVMICLFRF